MKLIRKILISDTQLKALLNDQESIFLVEKPEELNVDPYIVYFYKPLSGGYIGNFQFEFRLIGKDLSQLVAIQSRLKALLDDPRGEKIIKDSDSFVRMTKLLNGGGQFKNPATNNFEIVLYFQIKTN